MAEQTQQHTTIINAGENQKSDSKNNNLVVSEAQKSQKETQLIKNQTNKPTFIREQVSKQLEPDTLRNNNEKSSSQQIFGKDSDRSRSRQKNNKNYNDSKNNKQSYYDGGYKNSRDRHYDGDRRDGDRRDRRKIYASDRYDKSSNDNFVKEQAYRKTKMCPQMERGSCRKGSDCNFAHSQSQLRGLPDFKKTKLCIAFKEGKCGKLSSQCKYAHGEGELKRVPKVSHQRQSRRQRSPKRDRYSQKSSNYHYAPPPPPSQAYQNYLPPPYMSMNPYGPPPSLPIPNSSEYVNPRTLNIYNSGRPIYPEYTVPVNNSNPSLNYSGYGSYGPPQPPPTASYYPPMQPNYDPYGHYPNIPPPLPPSTGYGYPSLPKPPM